MTDLQCGHRFASSQYLMSTAILHQVRAGLASLGLRSLDELVGRADLLKQRDMALAKTDGLDLSFVTTYAGETGASSARRAQCVPCCFKKNAGLCRLPASASRQQLFSPTL